MHLYVSIRRVIEVRTISYIILLLLILAMPLAGNLALTHSHEIVHQQIYASYGVDSTIKANLLEGVTSPNQTQFWELDSKSRRHLEDIHLEFHMLDYPRSTFYLFVLMNLSLICMVLLIATIYLGKLNNHWRY